MEGPDEVMVRKEMLKYLRNMLRTNLFETVVQKNKLEIAGVPEKSSMFSCWSDTLREQLAMNEIIGKLLSLSSYCLQVSGGEPGTCCCSAEPKVQKKSSTCRREVRTSWKPLGTSVSVCH